MKLRLLAAFGAALVLGGCQTGNEADYMRIGYGPSFDVAHAQCDMRKGAVDQGFLAIGSPGFVAGASLGNAIGNAVAEDQYMKNCLILNGWKRRPGGATSVPATATAYAGPTTPVVTPAYYAPGSWINGAMLEYSSTIKQCHAGKKSACATASRLRRQLRAVGINP